MHYATVFIDKELRQPVFCNGTISAFCLGPQWHNETEESRWHSRGAPRPVGLRGGLLAVGRAPKTIPGRLFWRHPDQLPEPPHLDV